ncbi:hypothetical protein [Actinoplanes sp. NPDC026623]|uniref:hypothetical protein n=1 Tax=Actinoplanes sp. NPDC026623 TaxID=3155610 RepID=UPI0033F1FFBC
MSREVASTWSTSAESTASVSRPVHLAGGVFAAADRPGNDGVARPADDDESMTRKLFLADIIPPGVSDFGGGDTLTIIDDGQVFHSVYRLVCRFVIGHTATTDWYPKALGQRS